jgi:glutamate-1-semialdehyde 2,1-aminomutase/spore coat polysaccharide biosynthesis protein SpsF
LTVDQPADLAIVRALVDRLGTAPSVSIWEYARTLMQDRELLAAREGWTRNEGLWRSRNRDELENIGMKRGRKRSDELAERAARVIPSSTQTLSKASSQFVLGVTPTFLESGAGCHVTDVDGNIYIDYPMALGPIILGYNHPRTVEAVTKQVTQGTTFTLPHPLEVEVAELITEVVPCAEMVRFAKNGSDATDGAVRLARAVTGRNTILACGYHGWHDWYVVQTTRSDGVPAVLAEYIRMFPFNDLDAVRSLLDAHSGDVAAVILELGFDEPHPGYLQELRRMTHEAGALLIFDEIVTGFRLALGGGQEHYGVTPDVTCLGKAMANGLPLAAVVGSRQLMEGFERVFFSGTFGGETLSLAAAKVTIAEIRDAPVIEHMWTQGARLHAGLRESIGRHELEVSVIGQPPRGALLFRSNEEDWPALRGLFLQETVKRGVLFGGPVFVTYAHDAADIDRTVEICDDVFGLLAKAVASNAV